MSILVTISCLEENLSCIIKMIRRVKGLNFVKFNICTQSTTFPLTLMYSISSIDNISFAKLHVIKECLCMLLAYTACSIMHCSFACYLIHPHSCTGCCTTNCGWMSIKWWMSWIYCMWKSTMHKSMCQGWPLFTTGHLQSHSTWCYLYLSKWICRRSKDIM